MLERWRLEAERDAKSLMSETRAWRDAPVVIDDTSSPALLGTTGTSWAAITTRSGGVVIVEGTGVDIGVLRVKRLPEADLAAYVAGLECELRRADQAE